MARVISISPDLMLASRIDAVLSASGHEVVLAQSLDDAPFDGADLLVVDLDNESAEAAVNSGMPVLGYYSHTDAETRETAEEAGVDVVVPRSRMAREMGELVSGLLETPR